MTSAVAAALAIAMLLQISVAQPLAATAAIRGRVVRADGRALARAEVQLDPVDGESPPRRVVTDEGGRFEFVALPAGAYRVLARKAGYVALQFGERRPSEGGTAISLAAGDVRERVDILLPRTSAIAGRIVDENGEPVDGAVVRVLQTRRFRGRRALVDVPGAVARRTNDLGRYRLFGIQPGRYIVSASVGQLTPGLGGDDLPGYAPTFFPGTPAIAEAQFIAVRAAEDVLTVDFALARVPTARITGSAVDTSGNPITGGLSLLPSHRSSAVAGHSYGARISADGGFEFRNVPPGDYVVQAARARRNAWSEGEFASRVVTVNGSDVSGIDLHASVGSDVSGRIVAEPGDAFDPHQVRIVALPTDYDLAPAAAGPPTQADIHADGTFEMSGLHGPRRFCVTRAPRGWTLKAILVNGVDVTDGTHRFGARQQSLRDVQVVLSNRVTTLSGVVADSGTSGGKSEVVVFAAARDKWDVMSRFVARGSPEADATFRFEGLPPGEYYVAAIDRVRLAGIGVDDEWEDPDLFEELIPSAKLVSLFDGLETTVKLGR